ncbi:MAG: DUF1015 family protein [Euryarchaeota archaeon]|nr:DUF1015 family protein [Euryarchaeota archaeon]
MVRLLPVRAFHPDPDRADASRLVAPVYDTLSLEDHRRFDALPHNAASFTSRRTDLSTPAFLDLASQRLSAALEAEAFVQDGSPALYVYAIRYHPAPEIVEALPPERRKPDYLLLGLVGALPEDSGTSSRVALHERTFTDRVEERVALTERTGMHFAPIMAGYTPKSHAINDLIENYLGIDRRQLSFKGSRTPLVEATLDGATHRLWRLEDPQVAAEIGTLLDHERILILDGHHRFTAASRLQSRGVPVRPLTMLVEAHDKALLLLPWHRVLAPSQLTYDGFLSKGRSTFASVDELPPEGGLPEAIASVRELRAKGHRGFLAIGPRRMALVRGNDVPGEGQDYELLHRFLEGDLGLDPSRFSFVRSPRQAMLQVRGEGGVAFLLPPLSFPGIEQEAFAHHVMAQKSTMFLPKVAEGVIFAPALAERAGRRVAAR